MPNVTITVSAALLARLEALRDRHNAATGDSLTMKQYVIHELKEKAVADGMLNAERTLSHQRDQDYSAALETERQQLLADLS